MATRDLSREPVTDVTRLANRAAVLAFAAAFAIVVALIALPNVVRGGDPARRVVAAAALVVAFAVTRWAWRARAQLRAAQTRAERSPAAADGAPAQANASHDGVEAPAGPARPRRSSDGSRSRPRAGMRPHRT